MSKRFGRNQKRRLKQQLALASAQVQASEFSIQKLQEIRKRQLNEIYSLKGQLDQVAHILGHYFAGFQEPPTEKAPFSSDTAHYKMAIPSGMIYEVRPFDPTNADEPLNHTETPIQMNAMLAKLTPAQTGELRAKVHCRIEYRDGVWAYGISEEALRLPREVLARNIAREMSIVIANELQRKYYRA